MREGGQVGQKREKKDTDTQTPDNLKAVQTPSRMECFNNLQQQHPKKLLFQKVQKVSLQTQFSY